MPLIDVPSPMAGSVMEVLVSPGDPVAAGQELLLIESMKMEIPLESPAAGIISEILVAPRQKLTEGMVLLRIDTRASP